CAAERQGFARNAGQTTPTALAGYPRRAMGPWCARPFHPHPCAAPLPKPLRPDAGLTTRTLTPTARHVRSSPASESAPAVPWWAWRARLRAWWQSRLPLTDTLLLTQRNVYILPTRAGWML